MQIDELKNLVRSGQFGGITLDTSIFESQAFKLESGLLKQLEQFRDSSTKLIISEVVKEEVLSHLTVKTKEAKKDIEKFLKQAKDYWQLEDSEIERIKESVFDEREAQEVVFERFDQFTEDTSLEVIEAKDYLVIDALIQKYFRAEPPFSETGKKKNEFPDAIALISLERWAEQNETKMIVVSSDNDWKNFCKKSKYLVSVDDLAGALGFFQLENADDVCKYLSDKFNEGSLEELRVSVLNALENEIYNFDIYLDANSDSGLVYEEEITSRQINGFEFNPLNSSNIIFRPVNFDGNSLVVESRLKVNANIECDFDFSKYDSIDGDYVEMGGNTIDVEAILEVEVLITFAGDLNKVGTEIEIDNVEIEIKKPFSIDVGDIDPAWEVDEYEDED